MYDDALSADARILVADDNEDSRVIYTEILSLAGHSVITAADGEEAIAYALRVPFAVMILDLCLPKIDGFRVIKAVRSFPQAQATPIITVSAGDEQMHTNALAAGADLALRKPCLPDEMVAAVRSFVHADSRSRPRRRARS